MNVNLCISIIDDFEWKKNVIFVCGGEINILSNRILMILYLDIEINFVYEYVS